VERGEAGNVDDMRDDAPQMTGFLAAVVWSRFRPGQATI
jgi:hypothetical protein